MGRGSKGRQKAPKSCHHHIKLPPSLWTLFRPLRVSRAPRSPFLGVLLTITATRRGPRSAWWWTAMWCATWRTLACLKETQNQQPVCRPALWPVLLSAALIESAATSAVAAATAAAQACRCAGDTGLAFGARAVAEEAVSGSASGASTSSCRRASFGAGVRPAAGDRDETAWMGPSSPSGSEASLSLPLSSAMSI